MTSFTFTNKTTAEIADEILALVDAKGSMEDVTEAFEAVYNQKRDLECFIQDKVQTGLVERAKQDGAAWAKVTADLDAKPDDRQAMDDQLALLEDMARLRPMAQAFVKVFSFLGSSSDPWTKAIREAFPKLSDADKKSIPALAELFANTYDKLENNGAQQAAQPATPATRPPQWTDIVSILTKDGATSAIAKLESYDQVTRERFTNALERDFAYVSKTMFEKDTSVAAYKKENEKDLTENLAFGAYLAKAKGAAANPELSLYLDAISAVVNGPPENFSDLASVLPAVISHRTAADNQHDLKKLSQARKARTKSLQA
jgi:hypothetical protein